MDTKTGDYKLPKRSDIHKRARVSDGIPPLKRRNSKKIQTPDEIMEGIAALPKRSNLHHKPTPPPVDTHNVNTSDNNIETVEPGSLNHEKPATKVNDAKPTETQTVEQPQQPQLRKRSDRHTNTVRKTIGKYSVVVPKWVGKLLEFGSTFLIALIIVILLRTMVFQVMNVPTASMVPTIPVGTMIFLWQNPMLALGGVMSNPINYIPIIFVTIGIIYLIKRSIDNSEKNIKPSTMILKYFPAFAIIAIICLSPFLTANARESVRNGDIIVFKDDNGWMCEDSKPCGLNYLIKRVVASGGQKIEADSSSLKIDNKTVEEPYLSYGIPHATKPFEADVPKGKFWVMGDNRGESKDSRFFLEQTDSKASIIITTPPPLAEDDPQSKHEIPERIESKSQNPKAFIDSKSIVGKPFFMFTPPFSILPSQHVG